MKNFIDKSQHPVLASVEFFDMIQDPIFLIAEDNETFRYVYANPTAVKVFSLQKTDIRKRLEEVSSSAHIPLHYYREVQSSKKTVEVTETIRTENGDILGDIVLNPILSDDGNCTYILATLKEMTELKKQIASCKKVSNATNH
ncbi:PAS domain-containing protein [Planococcus halocryophilus]|uniref:PAS domain-containing protein n=1 Tax=Planococcus halocryophilus TaxID=1215089 RepID=UPI00034AD8C5|nr:PAS domain-containing protein [Planococcus halocryophilus]